MAPNSYLPIYNISPNGSPYSIDAEDHFSEPDTTSGLSLTQDYNSSPMMALGHQFEATNIKNNNYFLPSTMAVQVRNTVQGYNPDFHYSSELFAINTSVQPGPAVTYPPSAISEQSTVSSISTPSHESPSHQEGMWPSPSYPTTPSRKRSTSFTRQAVPYPSGRKRSSSDTTSNYPVNFPGPSSGHGVDNSFLTVPSPSQSGHVQNWPYYSPNHRNHDLVSMRTDQLFGNNYPNIYQAPAAYAAGSPTQRATPMAEGSFRSEVASPAVVEAARRKRKNNGGRTFDCKYCGRELTTKQNLQFHIKSHEGIRDCVCQSCFKTFTTPQVCKRHQIKCGSRAFGSDGSC